MLLGPAALAVQLPDIGVPAYILVDHATGTVLAEKAPDTQRSPASLTKIMTIFVVGDALAHGEVELNESVLVSRRAAGMGGSQMFLEPNSRVSVEDLLRGDIIQSGNDASVALAEHVSGSEGVFALLMNDLAEQLGMGNSNFVNSTGLTDPQHQTTPRDLALLSRALISRFPDIYKYFAETEFTYNNITQPNRNKLLKLDDSVDGIKTGYTEAAGYCLAASAVRGGRRLISVVMGADSVAERTEASLALLNYGFRFSELVEPFALGAAVTDLKVWKGRSDSVSLGLAERLQVVVPRRSEDRISASLDLPEYLVAPVAQGAPVGTLNLALDGEPLASVPLVSLASIPEGDVVTRLLDGVQLLFE